MKKCPEDHILIGHCVQSTRKNGLTPELQKTKSVVVNRKEKMKFTSLTISPGTAAVKWLLIMNLFSVQLQSLQRKMHTAF